MSDETNLQENQEQYTENDPEEQMGDTEQDEEPMEEVIEEILRKKAQPEEPSRPQMFCVKHNGREFSLTQDQLIENAQKGLDYDRIRADRDSLKNSDEITLIESLARQRGISRHQYMATARADMIKQGLLQQGYDERAAERLAYYQVENQKMQEAMDADRELKNRAETRGAIKEFVAMFPDVDMRNLPAEVVEEIDTGTSPLAAYQNYLLRQKDIEMEQLRQQQKNRQVSTGSVKGKPMSAEEEFMSYFMRDDQY